ncbi:nuclear transport factor 2 family protein [Gordonia rhizosphera]|uniref:SnoaL-like domain-containing protein n=1 Tax=Gordonia rhizosphera NBRC 16068 TaxID=1108045 RepID=K6VYT6_9ACTN|nr:nuclear transport factor 2 family protein [Gordonia rhizosphera]GAB92065.1 hypothetical protein GORHZ_159_00210 [Gordonia rhizosphera NBRC 16068]
MSNIHDQQRLLVSPEELEGVRALLHQYAYAVDSSDESLLAAVLTDDVVLHRVDGAREGADAVLAFYRTVFDGPTIWSKHLVTNLTCTVTPHGYDVDAYVQAISRTADTGMMVLAEYHDQVVRDDTGRYRIAVKAIDVQQTFPLEVRMADQPAVVATGEMPPITPKER